MKANVGDSYSFGWGTYPSDVSFTEITDDTVVGEESGYVTFYRDFGADENEGSFYVAIKSGDAITLYNVDCTGVTLKTIEDILQDACAYEYTDPDYTYNVRPTVNGAAVSYGAPISSYTNGADDPEKTTSATADLARFVGAIWRQDNGQSVTAIKYNNDYFTWDDQGKLKGSNWKNADDKTLVSVVAETVKDDITGGSCILTFTVNGETVTLNLTATDV